MINISLDLDDTILSFYEHYVNTFGSPKNDFEITKHVRGVLLKDKEFWLSQPVIRTPNFTPTQYTTSRIIPKTWIKSTLKINNLPNAPVYQVMGISLSKYKMLKGRVNVHVDDSIRVFKDLNSKGMPCLLMDSPYNQEWGPIGRVYSLDKDEIEYTYNLFLNTVFSNIKELL
jgi:hypothetical protein